MRARTSRPGNWLPCRRRRYRTGVDPILPAARLISLLLALLLLGLAVGCDPQDDDVPLIDPGLDFGLERFAAVEEVAQRLLDRAETMEAFGSQYTGYDGNVATGIYLAGRLDALGYDVTLQPVEVVVPTGEASLAVSLDGAGGAAGEVAGYTLYPLRPNGAQLNALAAPLETELIYVGTGDLTALDGLRLEGRIALMELTSDWAWLELFALGVEAVIFIEPAEMTAEAALSQEVPIPADLPRFWLPREEAGELLATLDAHLAGAADGGEAAGDSFPQVRLEATGSWERATAFNVVASRTSGAAGQPLTEPPLLLAAAYDAPGLVPALTPGGHQLLNAAAMLEVAEAAMAAEPARPLILALLSGHHQAMAGARAMVGAQRPAAAAFAPGSDALRDRLTADGGAFSEPVMAGGQAAGLAAGELGAALAGWLAAPLPRYTPGETMVLAPDIGPGSPQLAIVLWSDYYRDHLVVPNVRRQGRFLSELLQARVDGDLAGRAGAWDALLAMERPEEGYLLYRGNVDGTAARHQLFGRWTALPSEAFVMGGGMALNLVTTADPRPGHGTPLEAVEAVVSQGAEVSQLPASLANITVQTDLLGHLVQALLTLPPDLWPRPSSTSNQFGMVELRTVRGGTQAFVEGRTVAMPETLVLAGNPRGVIGGVETPDRILSDTSGRAFHMGSHFQHSLPLRAYQLEAGTGVIHAFADQGTQPQAVTTRSHPRSWVVELPLFQGHGATLQGLPPVALSRLHLYDRTREAPAGSQHVDVFTPGRLGEPWLLLPTRGLPGLVAAPAESRLIFQYRRDPHSDAADTGVYIAKASPGDPAGEGIGFTVPQRIEHALYRSAVDTWLLNQARLGTMRQGNLRLPEFDAEHLIAGRYLADAQAAESRFHHLAAVELFGHSLTHSEGLEPSLLNLSLQSILNLLLFLALTLFFGYFALRILVPRRLRSIQWLATGILVLALHLLLRASHPAYLLTTVPPEMLLFAFALLTLVAMALIHWWRNGEHLLAALKRQRRPGIGAETIDKGALAGVVFDLALTNLSRRQLRSSLTVVSLAVFAFAVLSSVALSPTFRYTAQFLDNLASYDGFVVEQQSRGQPLPERTIDDVLNFYGDDAVAIPHRWHLAPPPPVPLPGSAVEDHEIPDPILLMQIDGHAFFEFDGFAGVGSGFWALSGLEDLLIAGAPPTPGVEPAEVLISADIVRRHERPAGELIGEGLTIFRDDVELALFDLSIHRRQVMELSIAGVFDDERLRTWHDLYGRAITPPGSFPRLIVLTHEATLGALGEPLRSVAFAVPGGPELDRLRADVVPQLPYHFYLGRDGHRFLLGSSYYVLSQATSSLAIILVIGMLITLNTMIGGVYERIDELRIFGIVGMAPSHMLYMMLAEGVIFIVLGLGLGWIFFQAFFAVLAFTGWLPELLLNPGALTVMVTMLLLSAAVLSSAYIPANQAARLTAPTGELTWRLPWSAGTSMQGPFPFMVRRSELKGLLAFLWTFLAEHQRESFRDMTVRQLTLYLGPAPGEGPLAAPSGAEAANPLPGLVFQAHLAPYELGVIQRVIVYAVPEEQVAGAAGEGEGWTGPGEAPGAGSPAHGGAVEEDELLRVCYHVERQSGDQAAWHRVNQHFLVSLRRQLLIWQDMSEEAVEHYQLEGDALLQAGAGD